VLLDKARTEAVEDALRKAKLLTKAAGTSLGSVVTITEQEDHNADRLESSLMRMSSAPSSTPVARGERQFKTNVTLVISLTPKMPSPATAPNQKLPFNPVVPD
jgi:uncharacterized protein YggE